MSHLFYSMLLLVSAIASAPGDDSSGVLSAAPDIVSVEGVDRETVCEPPGLRLDTLPMGETLVYRGRVEKAGLSFDAGRAYLRVREDDEGRPLLEARARGTKFGYTLDTRISSILDKITLAPARHEVSQRGSERRTKKLIFREDGADFLRLKHCRDDGCADPAHQVKHAKYRGPIPWGTELAHCEDKKCKHREHYAWRTRLEHRYEEPFFDLLSAIYIARQAEFTPGADPLVIPIVNDTRRWNVEVRARKRKRIKVEAGTFDAVELVLQPQAADDSSEKEKFQGLFGLNGKIHIWVDRTTRRPILIEGTLPFAFLDLHAKIELQKIREASEDDTEE